MFKNCSVCLGNQPVKLLTVGRPNKCTRPEMHPTGVDFGVGAHQTVDAEAHCWQQQPVSPLHCSQRFLSHLSMQDTMRGGVQDFSAQTDSNKNVHRGLNSTLLCEGAECQSQGNDIFDLRNQPKSIFISTAALRCS